MQMPANTLPELAARTAHQIASSIRSERRARGTYRQDSDNAEHPPCPPMATWVSPDGT
jgi:hypothetical protein